MKALKITLMLAVFCLTVSGSSYETANHSANDSMKEINKDEFRIVGPVKKKRNLPGQNI